MEDLIEKLNEIKDVSKDRSLLYGILDELGVQYKKTNCKSCLKDLYNIAREELGVVGNASELSDFNFEDFTKEVEGDYEYDWIYMQKKPTTWNGHLICQDTPREVIEDFVERHPNGWFSRARRLLLQ